MSTFKCPHCGDLIGEGPGCEKCAQQVRTPANTDQVQQTNQRLDLMEAHLRSISSSLRLMLTIVIVVAAVYALSQLATMFFAFSTFNRVMQNATEHSIIQ